MEGAWALWGHGSTLRGMPQIYKTSSDSRYFAFFDPAYAN
jgi:hypothetical protein